MTNLIIFFLLIFFSFPLSAYPIFIGEIEVLSDSGNDFVARIPIGVDGKGELDVTLGDQDDYRRYSVKRAEFIDDIDLKVEEDPFDQSVRIVTLRREGGIDLPSFNIVLKVREGSGEIMENFFVASDYRKNVSIASARSSDKSENLLDIAKRLSLKPEDGDYKKEKVASKGFVTELTPDKSYLEDLRKQEESFESSVSNSNNADLSKERSKSNSIEKRSVKSGDVVYRGDNIVVTVDKSVVKNRKPMKRSRDKKIDQKVAAAKIDSNPVEPAFGSLPDFYKVRSGDTLYSILKRRGVKDKNINKAIVSVYKRNRSAFAEENLHGLMKGVKIDVSNLDKEINSLSSGEADSMLKEHWKRWEDWRLHLAFRKEQGSDSGKIAVSESIKEAVSKPKKKDEEDFKGRSYRYLIHIASFKDPQQSSDYLKLLRSRGINGYTAKISIKDKGDFTRVMVGRFKTKKEALKFSESIKDDGNLSYSRVLELPFAIKIGKLVPYEAAKLLIKELSDRGVEGYSIKGYGKEVPVLYGGYKNSQDASVDLANLIGKGYDAYLVEP